MTVLAQELGRFYLFPIQEVLDIDAYRELYILYCRLIEGRQIVNVF